MARQMKKTIEDCLSDLFNQFYHGRRISSRLQTLEQNLVATYLCDNLSPESCTYHFGRSVFASFAKKYVEKDAGLEKQLAIKTALEFDDDMNVDPIIKYCITKMRIEETDRRKPQLIRDKRKELEPNNAAMMASIMYKEIFRNKNLLEYARTAKDADDLKALLFIDYIFRSTKNAGIDEIMDGRETLETKALKVASFIRQRISSTSPTMQAVQQHDNNAYQCPGMPQDILSNRMVDRQMTSKPQTIQQYISAANKALEVCPPAANNHPHTSMTSVTSHDGHQILPLNLEVASPSQVCLERSRWKRLLAGLGLTAVLAGSVITYASLTADHSKQSQNENCQSEPWNQYCTRDLYKKK